MAKLAKPKSTSTESLITKESYNFLVEYLNNASPVGFESSGQKIWLNYLRQYIDSSFTDPYGTAVGVINEKHPFKVVIEAHADEISWFVNYINPEGLIYLKRNGGVDHQIAPSQWCLSMAKMALYRPCLAGGQFIPAWGIPTLRSSNLR